MKSLIVISLIFFGTGLTKLKPIKKVSINVKEPSSICYANGFYYVVSDNGKLYKTNKSFEVVKKSSFKGVDFEGVCLQNGNVLVSDETARKIYVFDTENLSLLKTHSYTYSGGRNKGVEAITYNPTNKTIITITEKEPSLIRFYTPNFEQVDEQKLEGVKDVSDITFYKNHYYVLSDEERKIKQYTTNFELVNEWIIPVINPEGIAFNEKELVITSDDLQKVYVFDIKTLNP